MPVGSRFTEPFADDEQMSQLNTNCCNTRCSKSRRSSEPPASKTSLNLKEHTDRSHHGLGRDAYRVGFPDLIVAGLSFRK